MDPVLDVRSLLTILCEILQHVPFYLKEKVLSEETTLLQKVFINDFYMNSKCFKVTVPIASTWSNIHGYECTGQN